MQDRSDYLTAQSGILGSMLIDSRVVGDIVTNLKPDDFSDGMNVAVFRAIRELYLDGDKIDPVLVLDRMGAPDPNKRKHLLDLMDITPTAANYQEYMAIVREMSRRREINRIGAELARNDLPMERYADLYELLSSTMVSRRDVECLSMEQGILDFNDAISRTTEYLSWGISFLDDGLTVERGDYVVLGGYPSDGKTALALSLAYHQAATQRVGFFSLETKTAKLFNRLYASAAGVSGSRIRRRMLTEDDFSKLEETSEELRHRNLHLVRSSSMTVGDIASYTRGRKFDVIYVDYLTLIQSNGKTETDRATQISMDLHRLAQDNNVTVVALSQLSRAGKGNVRTPTLESLRSSGQIEQDADVVLFIHRTNAGSIRSQRILSIAKNKEGVTGRIPLIFDGETQRFKVDVNALIAAMEASKPTKPQGAMDATLDQLGFTDLVDDTQPLPVVSPAHPSGTEACPSQDNFIVPF